MKKNIEILDFFGKLLIDNVYDSNLIDFRNVMNRTTRWQEDSEISDIFCNLSEEDKRKIYMYTSELIGTVLFSFLKIFEENEEFKLIYEQGDSNQVNLVEISEMLKAEPIIENGWIDRFSEIQEEINDNK